MRTIFCLSRNTFKQIFRKKINILVYIVLPIAIICGLMAMSSSAKASQFYMGVVDNDGSQYSQDMLNYLEQTNKFIIVEVGENEVNDKIVSRYLDYAFVIPEGFEESIYNGNIKSIEIKSIKGQETTVFIKQYANFYINNLSDIYKASEGNREVFNSIYEGYQKGTIDFNSKYLKDKSVNKSFTVMSLGIFVMIVLIACSTTANMLLKEKRAKTYYRIYTAPVKPSDIVISNILVNLMIVTAQISLAIFVVENVLKFETYIPPLHLFIVLFCFGFAAVGIGMLIMVFSDSTGTSSALTSLVITPSCMLAGCFWPRSVMPDFLQRVSLFIPQSWVIDALEKLQMGRSLSEVSTNMVIVLLFAVVFFLISAYKIKRSEENEEFI